MGYENKDALNNLRNTEKSVHDVRRYAAPTFS